MDVLRLRNTSPEILREWYALFEQKFRTKAIRPEDIWNMDETDLILGLCLNGRVIGSSRTKRTYKKTPAASREWVTVVEAISAAGIALRPLVIFKGKSLQSSWFIRDSIPDWHYTTSDNAYASNIIGLKWLEDVFLPETARNPPCTRMLLLDNQGSHVTIEFLWKYYENDVYPFFLIPHTSHICQPLDLYPFAVIKTKYRVQVSDLARFDDSDKIKKIRFIQLYENARNKTLTAENIKSG
jgi:DDE superfamily endonuclease